MLVRACLLEHLSAPARSCSIYCRVMFRISDVIPPRTTPVVTIGLIVANTLIFLYELHLDRHELFELARSVGMVPADLAWPNLVIALFVHDGWIHFGANMLYLWIFGENVEDSMGHVAYLIFYLGAGVLAGLAHAELDPTSTTPFVGASCAVAAVLGAYFVLFPKSQVLIGVGLTRYVDAVEVSAIVFLGAWLLIQVMSDLQSMGAQTADAAMTFGAQVVGFGTGLGVGGLLRWRGREWS
jgi:membrane associated rhomboid family serine protease